MMPRAHCAHPIGAAPLEPGDLEIIWSEEGDAAALYEKENLLAIIPSWSGYKGFHGYCRDAVGDGPLAWELGDRSTNVLYERFEDARNYWSGWDNNSYWPSLRDTLLEAYESTFGKHSRYFAIDGGNWPPKALVTFRHGRYTILASIGVSLRAQPSVEEYEEDSSNLRRMELAGCYSDIDEPAVRGIAEYISGQSALPWTKNIWLGHGHTIPAVIFATLSGGALDHALLMSTHPNVSVPSLPHFRGNPINLLWMIPVSAQERQLAVDLGSRVLWERLGNSADLTSFSRQPLSIPAA